MKKNVLKKQLTEKKNTYGCWLTIPHILIPEILAPAGFDWLVVDMEHSSIDLGDLLPLIISIEKNNMVPLVRVGENDPNLIKRVMDAGAYGVIVANVCSRKEAEAVVNAVKYPPEGTRGVGLYRAQGHGRKFDEYKKWVRTDSIVIVQIEHIDAVQCIDEILTTDGVDAFLIGPYDLSGSLGKPGDFEAADVKAALATVMAAARRHNVCAGFHSVSADPVEAARRRAQGYQFLAFSLDSILLGEAAVSAMATLRKEK